MTSCSSHKRMITNLSVLSSFSGFFVASLRCPGSKQSIARQPARQPRFRRRNALTKLRETGGATWLPQLQLFYFYQRFYPAFYPCAPAQSNGLICWSQSPWPGGDRQARIGDRILMSDSHGGDGLSEERNLLVTCSYLAIELNEATVREAGRCSCPCHRGAYPNVIIETAAVSSSVIASVSPAGSPLNRSESGS